MKVRKDATDDASGEAYSLSANVDAIDAAFGGLVDYESLDPLYAPSLTDIVITL